MSALPAATLRSSTPSGVGPRRPRSATSRRCPPSRASTPAAVSPRAAAAATCADTWLPNRLVPWAVWPWSAAQTSTPARIRAGGGAPLAAAQRSISGSSAPRLPPGLTRRSERSRALIAASRSGARGAPFGRRAVADLAPRFADPALGHHDALQRQPRGPARRLETRSHRPLVGPADAEVGDRVHALRDAEDRAQVGEPVEAHPADAEPLCARREPEVLDRAGRRVDVGVRDRAAAEDLLARRAVVAADADAERRLDDPLDLLVEELARALVEVLRLAQALARGDVADRDARPGAADDDEPPRLHEPDRRRAVRRREHALEHVLGHRVGAEAADVAALGDDAVHGVQRVVVVAPAARVGGALRRARGIVPRGRRRPVQARRVAHVGDTVVELPGARWSDMLAAYAWRRGKPVRSRRGRATVIGGL